MVVSGTARSQKIKVQQKKAFDDLQTAKSKLKDCQDRYDKAKKVIDAKQELLLKGKLRAPAKRKAPPRPPRPPLEAKRKRQAQTAKAREALAKKRAMKN